jgi:hypothetical protein
MLDGSCIESRELIVLSSNLYMLNFPSENPWVRRSRTLGYEHNWIQVHHDEITRPDGNPGVYGVVHYRRQSVGIVAIDARDQALLVGQYRYTLDAYSWEIPAGGSIHGEDVSPRR